MKLLTTDEALRKHCPFRNGNCQGDNCMLWVESGTRPTGKEKIVDNGHAREPKRYTIAPETEPTGFCRANGDCP